MKHKDNCQCKTCRTTNPRNHPQGAVGYWSQHSKPQATQEPQDTPSASQEPQDTPSASQAQYVAFYGAEEFTLTARSAYAAARLTCLLIAKRDRIRGAAQLMTLHDQVTACPIACAEHVRSLHSS